MKRNGNRITTGDKKPKNLISIKNTIKPKNSKTPKNLKNVKSTMENVRIASSLQNCGIPDKTDWFQSIFLYTI